jgi:hypothetical protein
MRAVPISRRRVAPRARTRARTPRQTAPPASRRPARAPRVPRLRVSRRERSSLHPWAKGARREGVQSARQQGLPDLLQWALQAARVCTTQHARRAASRVSSGGAMQPKMGSLALAREGVCCRQRRLRARQASAAPAFGDARRSEEASRSGGRPASPLLLLRRRRARRRLLRDGAPLLRCRERRGVRAGGRHRLRHRLRHHHAVRRIRVHAW